MAKQTFYIQDCIDGCKQRIADGTVDLVFADPPFNIEFEGSGAYVYGVSTDRDVYYNDNMTPEDYGIWCKKWIAEGYRILHENGIMLIMTGWNYRRLIENAAIEDGFSLINEVIWRYEFGVFTTKKFVTSHYTFLVLLKGDPEKRKWTFNKIHAQEEDVVRDVQLFLDSLVNEEREKNVMLLAQKIEEIFYTKREKYVNDDFMDDLLRLSKRYVGFKHSCKLSEDVLMRFYTIFTNENDFIVDMFVGGGTSLLSAILMNRRFIGFEIQEKYKSVIVSLVKKRISEKNEVKRLETL